MKSKIINRVREREAATEARSIGRISAEEWAECHKRMAQNLLGRSDRAIAIANQLGKKKRHWWQFWK